MAEVTLQAYENEIDEMLEEARYVEAFAHLRHLIKHYPRYYKAYYLLGRMMLDAELHILAQDMFRRVLNADPENLLARIGLGLAHEDDKASLWNLERAFELDPGNEELASEILRLRGKLSGVQPDYVPLSRAGMARLYLKGHLYSRAVAELRSLLKKEPQRVDLRVALAEAYWRDNQIVQAADTCQQILEQLPYCLKANLILGTLWLQSGQEEGRRYLKHAEAVDPENRLATELFGAESFLKEKTVTLERLAYDPEALSIDQETRWFKRLEAISVSVGISEAMPDMSEEEMQLVDIAAGLDSQIQIPDWLEELGPLDEEGEGLAWLEEEEIQDEELAAWLETEADEGTLPDWLQERVEEEAEPEAAIAAEADEEALDWLQEMAPSEKEEVTPPMEAVEEAPLTAEEEEEGVPDWLWDLRPPKAGEVEEYAEAPSDWLEEEPQEEEEIPDWLRELQASQEPEEAPKATAREAPSEKLEEPEEAAELPDWLRELQTQEEIEERAAAEAVETEEMFGWTSFDEEEEVAEAAALEALEEVEEEEV
ncbi:MAG: tetratricopeptide repeat protein, partial [Anaerolineae bacterium]